MSIKDKEREYEARLNEIYLTLNLGAPRGTGVVWRYGLGHRSGVEVRHMA